MAPCSVVKYTALQCVVTYCTKWPYHSNWDQSIIVCVCVCRWVWISLTRYCPQPSKRAVLSLIRKVPLLHSPSFFSFLSTLFSLLTTPKPSFPTSIPYYLCLHSYFNSTPLFFLLPLIYLFINFLSLISPFFIFLYHRDIFNQPYHSFIHLSHRRCTESHRRACVVLRKVRHSLPSIWPNNLYFSHPLSSH
jgi:hypothetical protein